MTYLQLLKSRGEHLILRGPQACGKTLLATQLAEAEGVFSTINGIEMTNAFPQWLENSPKAVIVEEFNTSKGRKYLEDVAFILESDKLMINKKYAQPLTVCPPIHIFCVNSDFIVPREFVHVTFSVIDMIGAGP
jgi:hypothetical protein